MPPASADPSPTMPIQAPHRTVYWQDGALMMIDQRLLPEREAWLRLETAAAVAEAIRDMAVRGAPAIGVAAAFGMVLGLQAVRASGRSASVEAFDALEAAAGILRASRPTAVNLAWAVDRQLGLARTLAATAGGGGPDLDPATLAAALLAGAERIADEDVAACRAMGRLGAALLPDPCTVIHHCNTGALAAVDHGTALGVVRSAHEAGKRIHVLVDETRPRLQGARLTAWELGRLGIPHSLIVDGAAAHFMAQGGVDAVLVGADRIAANGDTANKIGTYGLAVAARHHGLPFYVVAPANTVDAAAPDGAAIPIEHRAAEELTVVSGRRVAPEGTPVLNPAFDITPADLITAIVTEHGVARPPYGPALAALLAAANRGA